MNTLELWPALHKAAMLGTSRGGEAISLPQDAPEHLRAAMRDDREGALLSLLVAASLQRRAGIAAPSLGEAEVAASPCAQDSWPIAAGAACSRIHELSWGADHAALREWLGLARSHQVLAPHDSLPRLLRLGTRAKNLRGAILGGIGERGRWLAAQNPEWKWAARFVGASADEAESAFRDGEGAARQEAFELLRALDANRAVQVLEAAWAHEDARHRRRWVEMLRLNPDARDEAFLERALDDRDDEVRKVAAGWLIALPDSAFARRAFERASKYLSARREGSVLRLEILLPSEWDPSWNRDGLVEDGAGQGAGTRNRMWWLAQMIGVTTLARWEAAWGAGAREIVEAVARDERALLDGLMLSATRTHDDRWMLALLAQREHMATGLSQQMLFSDLAADGRDQFLTERARAQPSEEIGDIMSMLSLHDEPWSRDLSQAVLDWMDVLARELADKPVPKNASIHNTPGASVLRKSTRFATLMHLETLADAPLNWPEVASPIVQSARDALRITCATRREMRREFDSRPQVLADRKS